MPGSARTQLMLLGAGISVIKIVLFTAGTSILLARTGAEGMPWFYLAFAGLAVLVSLALAAVVDRRPPMALLARVLVLAGIGAVALWAMAGTDHPLLHLLALASAHLFEIVTDVLFWLAAGVYLTSYDLRRATPWLLAGMAGGGLIGGVAAGGLAHHVAAQDLLLAVPALAGLTLAQVRLMARRMRPLPEPAAGEEEESPWSGLRSAPLLLRRHTLAVLLALSSFMLTLVYAISEYLSFAAYEAAFPDEAALTRFIGLMFGVLQASELILLLTAGRMLVERCGPLLRNLAFPALALSSLLLFFSGNRLLAGVVTHVTTESVSNALFEPANAGNYAALPRGIHGRVRALSNGILYPLGLAAGGLVLLAAGRLGGEDAALVAGLVSAAAFLALAFAIGRRFLPDLVGHLRGGVEHYAVTDGLDGMPEADLRVHVRDLARARDPEARRLAAELALRLDSATALDLLRPVLDEEDARLREALGGIIVRLPSAQLRPLLHTLARSTAAGDQLLAARVLLARPDLPSHLSGRHLARSARPIVACLGGLVLRPRGGAAKVGAVQRALESASPAEHCLAAAALAGAAVPEHRAFLTGLVGVLEPEAVQAALRTLATSGRRPGTALPFVTSCLGHPDPATRLAALEIIAPREPLDPKLLGALLEDVDARVRGRAAAAFAGYGWAGIAPAAERLDHPRRVVRHAAIAALGAIGGPEARSLLMRVLAPHQRFAQHGAAWLDLLRSRHRPAAFDELGEAVESRSLEAVDTGLAVAAALGGGRLVGDMRRHLSAQDPRRRADALEALASSRERHLLRPLMPLIERQIRIEPAEGSPPAPVAWSSLARAAAVDPDPWIKGAGRRAMAALEPRPPEPAPAALRGESPMHRLLTLRRIALFRRLPLDTLARVDGLLEERVYAQGEILTRADAATRQLCILLRGSVLLTRPGHAPRLICSPATFGEGAVIDEAVAPAHAVANEPCVVLRMSAVVFNDLAREHPEIWMEVSRELARRLEAPPDDSIRAA